MAGGSRPWRRSERRPNTLSLGIETAILLWIHQWANPCLDGFFRLSHFLGRLPAFVVLVLSMVLWRAERGERRQALTWLLLGLTTIALLEGLKWTVGRPRPMLWPRLVVQTDASFPSGHALAAATFYPLLAWQASRLLPRWTRLWCTSAILGSAWLGVGRLYLGVHWPSDVLAGWALGSIQACLGQRLLEQKHAGSG